MFVLLIEVERFVEFIDCHNNILFVKIWFAIERAKYPTNMEKISCSNDNAIVLGFKTRFQVLNIFTLVEGIYSRALARRWFWYCIHHKPYGNRHVPGTCGVIEHNVLTRPTRSSITRSSEDHKALSFPWLSKISRPRYTKILNCSDYEVQGRA